MSAARFDFRTEIEKAIAAFEKSANAKDAVTIASFYTEDATLMPQGSPPIKGRSNILAFWQAFLSAGASDAKLRVVEVDSDGDLAYEIGAFDANMPNPQGGLARTAGKYLAIWKRQPDGSVKMTADMFGANS